MKNYLLIEDGKRFYIEALNIEWARERAKIWNAEVIKEVKDTSINPNTIKLN